VAETKTDVKLISWPSPQDYNEAIQNLLANTQDPQLQKGHVGVNALGLPRSASGAFASVYRVHCGDVSVAVRCFLRDIRDQEQRYKHISQFVQNDTLPYTVTFDFLPTGIRVGPRWVPVLKMDWVEGHNLDLYVEKNLGSPEKIARLADSFLTMCRDLQNAGIAHGDLQHGNIIVCGEELRLVDYDGMYVPAMKGMRSNEIGHRNFQHPMRGANDFGPHLDNFAAWVIYVSLRSIAIDPKLFTDLAAGDDCLLFRRDDFVEPEHSFAFAVLENHPNEEVRSLAKFLRWQAGAAVADVPPLTAELPQIEIPDLPVSMDKSRRYPRSSAVHQEGTGLPDWIDPHTIAGNAVRARQRPKAAPLRPQVHAQVPAGIEPELVQAVPRLVVHNPDKGLRPGTAQWLMLLNPLVWLMFWSFTNYATWGIGLMCLMLNVICEVGIVINARSKKLLQNGECVRTTSMKVIEGKDAEGTAMYSLEYSFKCLGTRRIINAKKSIGYGQFKEWSKKSEATVIYDPWDPNANNEFYERMIWKAVNPVIPIGIEPELATFGPRKTHFRTDRFIDPVALTFVSLLSPAFWLMFYGGGVGIVGFLVTTWLTWMVWHESWRDFNLVRAGIPSRGIVKAVNPPLEGMAGSIDYQFQSVKGIIQMHERLPESDCGATRVGDIVTVLYDVNNPERNIIYKWGRFIAD
jgi:hypothetical protein